MIEEKIILIEDIILDCEFLVVNKYDLSHMVLPLKLEGSELTYNYRGGNYTLDITEDIYSFEDGRI